MAYDGRYDDPKFINAFLVEMKTPDNDVGNVPARVPNTQDETRVTQNGETAHQETTEPKAHSGTNTPAITSATSSPPTGIRAPPPTPENRASAATDFRHLPPICEDQDHSREETLVTRERSGLRPSASSFNSSETTNPCTSGNTPAGSMSPKMSETKLPPSMGLLKNYHEDVIARFRASANARMAANPRDIVNNHIEIMRAATERDVGTDESREDAKLDHLHSNPPIPQHTRDESTAVSEQSSSRSSSSVDIIVDAPKSPGSFNSQQSLILNSTPDATCTTIDEGFDPNDKRLVTTGKVHCKSFDALLTMPTKEGKSQSNAVVENDKSRENANYFSTWGTPTSRDAEPSRIRKIVLTNLCTSADFTLIQAIIHGGSIETMSFCPAANGSVTAFVTFTTADACEKYFERYPNGLTFKFNGNKQLVFVSKGQHVDVVSSALRFYLDCGASRVIRAVGADHDWSMRALHKIAGGSDGRRKIETIIDHCRNEIRTITFRFTKIADAVTFRGQLLRNTDWEDADIQFLPDPCEKATGVHFE